MKKKISKLLTILVVALSFSVSAQAQLRVSIRPSVTIHTRPARPSSAHVWVGGEWVSHGGRYEYREGYWAKPPRHHRRYVEGHWAHTRSGYYWVPGRWY